MLKSFLRQLFKRNSFLMNLLISVVGLICVPLICIQLFMILQSTSEFEQETVSQYRNSLRTLGTAFDTQLDSLAIAAIQASKDGDMMEPVTDDTEGYDLKQIAIKVNRTISDTPFVDSMAIYYTRRDICLHQTYKRSVQETCDLYYPAGSPGNQALADFIRNTEGQALFSTDRYPDAVSDELFVASSVIYYPRTSRDAVVFFSIKEEKLVEWCSLFLPVSTGFSIVDTDGEYILKSADFTDALLEEPGYQDFLSNTNLQEYASKSAEDLTFYKYRDAATGRVFITAVPAGTTAKIISGYTQEAARTLLITIVLLMVLLTATLYINYRPMLRLVSKYIEEDIRDSKLSELEMIDSHFFALDQRINDQENLLATFTMSDLLSGIRVPREAAERYFAPEVYRSFVAATASIPLTSAQTNEVCRLLADRMPGKLIITTVPYRPETVLVYCSREAIRLPELTAALESALDQVAERSGPLHFGPVVPEVTHIQSSYSDALPTEKLALVSGKDSPEEYPYAMLQFFVQQACAGEDTRALETLDILEAAVAKLKPSSRRFVTQKLLYSYLSGLQKGGIRLPEAEVDQMLAFPNSTLLFKLLRSSVASVKRREDAQCISGQTKLEEQLLAFVDERYLDSSLCLSAAADYLQTSIYSVSRIFKERTGMGFKEYITGKRLRQACRLLRTTTLPVTAIASQCGFENANYFTVVFRTEYGIPPSKYRAEATAARQEANEQEESE